jgi:hypothetical protein
VRPFPLAPDAAPAVAALAVERGWLPHEEAWRIALAVGEGVGFSEPGGPLDAMALLVPHGPGDAVLSVLSSPRVSGQGLGRRAAEAVLGRTGLRGVEMHAPPAGRTFAERLGFRAAGSSTRFVGRLAGVAKVAADLPGGASLRPVGGADFPAVVAVDEVAFGATRRPLLEALFGRARRACLAVAGGRTVGYGVSWSDGEQLVVGPVVAEEESVGVAMIGWLAGGAGDLDARVDVPDEGRGALTAVAALGLAPRGRIARLVRGPGASAGRRERLHALAAPWAG